MLPALSSWRRVVSSGMILKTSLSGLAFSPKYVSLRESVTVLLASSYLSSLNGPVPTGAVE